MDSRSVEPPPTQAQDLLFYRIAVLALSLAVVLTIALTFVLSYVGRQVPDGLIALGAGAGGALGGLLVPAAQK